MARSISEADQTKHRDLLKAQGHNAARIDALLMSTERQLRASMKDLHNLTDRQYDEVSIG